MIYSKDTFAFTASTNVVAIDEEVALRWLAESRMIAGFTTPESAEATAQKAGLESYVIWVKGNSSWLRW